jgi:hypothetical protein
LFAPPPLLRSQTLPHFFRQLIEEANLLYLSGALDDPARAEAYLDVADKVLADIAVRRCIAPPGSIDGLP